MNKLKFFVVLSGYQLTWFACVFGENFIKNPLVGFFVGSIFVIFYMAFVKNIKRFLLIVSCIAIPGYLFDSIVVYFEVYKFYSSIKIGLLPIWMIVLWLSFAILFDEVLVFLKNYKIIGTLMSTILGPLTYYSGELIGIIKIQNLQIFIIIMCVFWMLLMVYYLNIILKKIDYSEA